MDTSSVLDENVSQWCNGHYELVYSCLIQLNKLRKPQKPEPRSKDGNTGFIHRFWNKFRSGEERETRSDKKHQLPDDGAHSDVSDDFLESFYEREVDIDSLPLEALKTAVNDSISKSLFHRPLLVPKRRLSLTITDLVSYVKSRFEDLLDNVDNIDHFSQLANIDQYLCCELLYEGICYYGVDEAQKLAEFVIIENMLYRQSKFQLRCIIKLFSFINVSSDGRYVPDSVFPEALDILRGVISKGLVRNICMLILGTMKEASRYKSLSADSDDYTLVLLRDNALDLLNITLEILNLYLLKFQATDSDIGCLMSLLPHLLNLHELFNLSEFSSSLSIMFKGYEEADVSSLYPPSLGVASLWPTVKEFDESFNSFNLSKKFVLLLIGIFHPKLHRFDSDAKISTLVNPNFIEKIKKPLLFKKYYELDLILEFVIHGIFFNDLKKIITYIDAGIFRKIRNFAENITDTFVRSCTNTVTMILRHLLFHNGSLDKNWFSILDYEIKCKHNSVDLARLPRKDTLDESIYRDPGKSLIELIELMTKLGIHEYEDLAFSVWKSCAESYKSIVPKPQYLVYRCRNSELEGRKLDSRTFERLTTPEKGFCWWERNNTLLELVAAASNSRNIFVETYPILLTCILEFGSLIASGSHNPDTRKQIGQFLSSGASRDLQFPFLLERVVLQIKSLANGDFERLPDLIYERIIARDDQIETAEAAIQIASSIPSKFPQKLPLDGSCLTRLYTFPLIHSPNEVKVALCSLGLGKDVPFGLFNTASAVFNLVSICNPMPQHPLDKDWDSPSHFPLNIRLGNGDRDHNLKYLDMLFSILSHRFIRGSENMISSILGSLCSVHICNLRNTVAALERISELLYDDKSALGRLKNGISIPELVSLMKSLAALLLFLPKEDRFKVSVFDWLHKLVKFSLNVLDLYCLQNTDVDWSLVSAVLDFLLLVAKGPVASQNCSKATEYLLEQFLIPGSTLAISVVRAANDAKLLPAISLICIILKRDVLLIVAHRTALFLSNNKGGICPSCNKCSNRQELKHKQDSESVNSYDWWPLKIQKLSGILSSHKKTQRFDEVCECINLNMHPISLQMAHDAIMEALATLRDKNDALTFKRRCDFIGSLEYKTGNEIRIKSLFILAQMVERMGIDSLFLSDNVVLELQRVFNAVRPCKEFPEFVNEIEMESGDLILYNKLVAVNNTMNYNMEMENIFFSFGHLTNLNRYGYDDLFYHLLYRCSLKDFCNRLGPNLTERILGHDFNIISLIKLCRDGEVWDFGDWKRIDAFYSLISLVKRVPRVGNLVLKYWPDIASDVHGFEFSTLDYNTFIMQALRLSNIIHLLSILYEHNDYCVRFNDDMLFYVKLCSKMIRVSCDTQNRIYVSMLQKLRDKLTNKDDTDIKRFLDCWRYCGFPKHISEVSKVRLCTRVLNLTSVKSFGGDKEYVDASTLYNIFTCSSASLLTSLLSFISHCHKFNIKNIGKLSRNWLELASVEFNPDERSELKLTLQIALVKKLVKVWVRTNVEQKHDDALFSVSIALKFITFVLTRKTSTHLRSKVYSCVNLLLSNDCTKIKITELLVAHLLSQMFNFSNTSLNNRVLQILFSDASFSHVISEKDHDDVGRRANIHCVGIKTNKYLYKNFSSVVLGEDYSGLNIDNLAGKSQGELLELGYILNNENLHISIDGSSVDCRIEALKLLSSILLALRRFEASCVEYDTGTLSYGSLGTLSLKQIALVIQNRLIQNVDCKKCQLNPPYCPLCIDLITGAVSVLESVSKLHQFSSFWFHTNPLPSTSLSDSLLSCNILMRYNDFPEKLPINLILPLMVILEHFLNSPSVKTKNDIVSWLSRHSELLTSFITKTIELGLATEVIVFVSSFLRVYRISLLWLLSEYRGAESKETYKENFNLVLADLNCRFPLAISVPKLIPELLGALTSNIDSASDKSWLCILLSLQTFFPELGAFEINFDVSAQTPIKILALERCNVIITVLNACGNSLVKFIKHISPVDHASVRHEIHRLALRIMTLDCSLVLLEYIFSLVVDKSFAISKGIADDALRLDQKRMDQPIGLIPKLHGTNIEKITNVLDNMAQICRNNGVSLADKIHGRKHSIIGASLEFLTPHELEHVPSLGSTSEATYSYKSLLLMLFSSICNLAVILEKHYGCKFESQAIISELSLENNRL